jgi:hypothetical protein
VSSAVHVPNRVRSHRGARVRSRSYRGSLPGDGRWPGRSEGLVPEGPGLRGGWSDVGMRNGDRLVAGEEARSRRRRGKRRRPCCGRITGAGLTDVTSVANVREARSPIPHPAASVAAASGSTSSRVEGSGRMLRAYRSSSRPRDRPTTSASSPQAPDSGSRSSRHSKDEQVRALHGDDVDVAVPAGSGEAAGTSGKPDGADGSVLGATSRSSAIAWRARRVVASRVGAVAVTSGFPTEAA